MTASGRQCRFRKRLDSGHLSLGYPIDRAFQRSGATPALGAAWSGIVGGAAEHREIVEAREHEPEVVRPEHDAGIPVADPRLRQAFHAKLAGQPVRCGRHELHQPRRRRPTTAGRWRSAIPGGSSRRPTTARMRNPAMSLMLEPFRIVTALALAAIVGACATPGRYESKPSPAQRPSPAPVEERGKSAPVEPAWVPPPARPGQREGMSMLTRLFPEGVSDRDGWAADIFDAFAALQLPATPENFCAAIAVIEQESTFHADPVVPGLSRIAWKEIEARRKRYGMPRLLLDAALARTSPNGRSYKARIDTLRTEKQMSELFEDLISEFPYGEHLFARYNPVRTGGPMQVSVQFA